MSSKSSTEGLWVDTYEDSIQLLLSAFIGGFAGNWLAGNPPVLIQFAVILFLLVMVYAILYYLKKSVRTNKRDSGESGVEQQLVHVDDDSVVVVDSPDAVRVVSSTGLDSVRSETDGAEAESNV